MENDQDASPQPNRLSHADDLPLKKLTNRQIGIIAFATLLITLILIYLLNKLLSPSRVVAPTPSPEVTLEPVATLEPIIDPADIPTPEPSGTPTPKPSPTTTPTPTASASAAPSTTLTLTSPAGQDGWEDSNATSSATQEIKVGRTTDATIRGFVGFDIGNIPKTAKISKAILRIYQTSVSGNPYGIGGNIVVDHGDFGSSITAENYSGGNIYASNVGTISSGTQTGWKELDVTTRVTDDLVKHTSTQFRLRFTTETAGGDDVALFSSPSSGGNTPQLVVTYN